MLNKDEDALFELKKFQIPVIGFVDTDMNPSEYVYKFFGNNDAFENIEFFFTFLQEALKEGRIKEQQIFYFYFIHKIKQKLY
jgi:ribosomal protein S2